ncbi:MAG: RsmG family class I SAM-dependent methyltransferase [Actinomycetota bacterium]
MPRSVRDVLVDAQRIGALGSRPIDDVIAHARAFVEALPPDTRRIIDLGSGAGVPGLVVADALPEATVVLVDRRAKRTDALALAVAGLGWRDRVSVICADVESLVGDPAHVGSHDAVISRGFGPHETTLRLSAGLVRPGGVIVVSEPPEGEPNRWSAELVKDLTLTGPERLGPVARFRRN